MDITILDDRVLIKHQKAEEVSAGGLFIASGAAEKKHEALVLKVGAGKKNKEGIVIPLLVKENDRILYDIEKGIKVKLEGQNLLIIKEDDIFAVLED